jgi:hypothetical protein
MADVFRPTESINASWPDLSPSVSRWAYWRRAVSRNSIKTLYSPCIYFHSCAERCTTTCRVLESRLQASAPTAAMWAETKDTDLCDSAPVESLNNYLYYLRE